MADLRETRLSLHAVAELLLAGPQFAQSKSIELRATQGGFGTVAAPDVRVERTSLLYDGAVVALTGRTVAEVAREAGIHPRSLDDIYSGGCGLTVEHTLTVGETAAAELAEAFRRGDEALAAFAPDAARVLWPEHFDIGITVDEVNYGVSPGDSYLEVPYAYVGPWEPDKFTDSFWNAPFGSARPLLEIGDVAAYFAEGAALAR
jgi:hypothetical protein